MRLFRLLSTFICVVVGSMTLTGNTFADPFSALIKNNRDGSQTLTGHVPSAVKKSTALFKYHALSSETVNIKIILPLQNQSQLTTLLKGLYDPKSPNFHQFLTPKQFAQQFGASSIDTQEIQGFLNKKGFSVTGQSQNGTVLSATGPVRAIEQAFGLHINHYQKADGTPFFSPDTDPTIPTPLAGKILAIGGLDNLAKYQAHYHQVAPKTPPTAITGLTKKLAIMPAFTGPGSYVAPNDVKTAYNLNAVPATGAGQTLALFEMDGYVSSDIAAYDTYFSLPGVPLQNILIDGFNGVSTGTGGNYEVTLDIELMTAFAPGASKILVYEAPNTFPAWADEWNQIAQDDTAKIISCSWGSAEPDSPTISTDNIIFQQLAVQGQAVFAAAGDSGAYSDGSTLSVLEPAAQPYVTGVGISALSINTDRTYQSETASLHGGGGISALQSIPSYQTTAASGAVAAALVSTTNRNVPDVALTADPSTAYSFYITGVPGYWGGFWGSSLSAPIWASFMSLVNQTLGTNGPLGFANPYLYQIALSNNYANDFHDITTGNNQHYPAEPGFDDAIGLGSFNGANLFNDLVSSNLTAPYGLKAIGGQTHITLSWVCNFRATSYNVKRSMTSGGPYTTIASPTVPNYIDTNPGDGVNYYVVSAVDGNGETANSTQASASIDNQPPSAPTGLVGTDISPVDAKLTWNPSTDNVGVTGYQILRNGSPVGTTSVTSYDDTTVIQNNTYTYTVVALDAVGNVSAQSAPVLVAVTPDLLPPTVPTNVSIGTATANSLDILWTPSTDNVGVAGYKIFRQGVEVAVTPYNEYFDTDLSSTTKYTYTIAAYDAAGNVSVQSAPVIGKTLPPAPTVPILTATPGNATVNLSWTNSIGAQVYYIYKSFNGGATYELIAAAPVIAPSFTDTSVSNGITYYYYVAADNGGSDANSNIVSATPVIALPMPPTNVAIYPHVSTLTVTWTLSPGASSYNVKRSLTNGGPYTTVGSSTSAGYTDGTVIQGTFYYYVVTAVNVIGESGNSAQVNATTLSTVPPTAPANVSIGTTTQNSIYISWSPSTDPIGVSGYEVYRNNTPIGDGGSTSFLDNEGLSPATSYSYTVSAFDANGNTSAKSAPVIGTTLAANTPPSAPSNLRFSLELGAGNPQVLLTWSSSPTATSYNVKRSTTSGGPYTTIASAVPTNYTDASIIPGGVYYYVVSAVNTYGESPNSPSGVIILPPATPTALAATPGIGSVSLSWNSSNGATSYNIKRSTVNGSGYTTINNVTATNYTDTTATNSSTTYYYVVSGVSYAGESSNSAQVSATPLSSVPPAPSGLTAVPGNFQVSLSWSPINGITQYNVKRATVSGGPYTTVAAMTVPANSPGPINYLDLHLNNGTTYFYVVSAVNTAGEGPNSAEVNATPVSPFPSVPTRLNAVQIGNLSQIQLTWAVSVGSSSYNVKRSTVSGGPYTTIASTLDPTTTYTDTPVTYGTIYYYVVSGANIKGESANSTEVSATPQAPPPNVPTGLSAKAASSTAVNLIWQASTDSYGVVSGYNIYRNGVLSASSSTTSYSDTGLSPATTYTYTVSAYDAFGSTSAQSTSAKAVTPPSAPTGLTASPSDAQVALTWNASTGAVSYNVLRLVSGGTWIKIVTGLTQLTYTDTTVINGTYYAYIAQAVSVGGQTANSTSVRVLPDPPKPSTPANLAAVPGDGQVALSWSPSSEATSYTIEGRPSSGTWSVLATGVTLPSYTDTTVSNGTRYFYFVKAVNIAGSSPNSTVVNAMPVPPAPPAPTGLTAGAGNGQVVLTWNTVTAASSYIVKRAPVGGTWVTLATGVTSTSYTDTTVANGTSYYYLVVAFEQGALSPNSKTVLAKPVA